VEPGSGETVGSGGVTDTRSYVISDEALGDIEAISDWTVDRFGPRQAGQYLDAIKSALTRVRKDPFDVASRARGDLLSGWRTFHLGRVRRRARHVVLYAVTDEQIVVLRILHERMDVASQVAPEDDPG
jgi:toxin ParE1/3/4